MRQKRMLSWEVEGSQWSLEADGDDGEAAFWDEFFFRNNESETKLSGGEKFTIKVVNEETGEEKVFSGIDLRDELQKLD